MNSYIKLLNIYYLPVIRLFPGQDISNLFIIAFLNPGGNIIYP